MNDDESTTDSPAPSNPGTPVIDLTSTPTAVKNCFPKVTLEDIIQAKEDGNSLEKLLLKRYKCQTSSKSHELIARSKVEKVIENVCAGLDPAIYSETDQTKWYSVSSKEQYYALLDSLNNRGIREQQLLLSLNNEKVQIVEQFLEEERKKEKLANKRPVKQVQKKNDPQSIDKSLFKCMEDYIEGSLRDAILELEERIWVAGFGGVKTEERLVWREHIEEGMSKLIQIGTSEPKKESEDEPMKIGDNDFKANGLSNGDHEDMEIGEEQTQTPKAIPLHLQEVQTSRCSTPVDEQPENTRIEFVRDLAQKLLMV